jgi:hypothetical protein
MGVEMMTAGAVLGRIPVVVCSCLGRVEHRRMPMGMVEVVGLEADVKSVGSWVIAVDMAGEVAQDHNVRNGN